MFNLPRITLTGTLFAGLLLAACQPITMPADHGEMAADAEHAEAASEDASEEHVIHWGYSGEGGPDHWGELNPDYAACAEGMSQSPIDLVDAAGEDLDDIVFNYGESKLKILNNGHTVQANYDEGSTIMVDGMEYNLLQFHFHTASEHTVAGEQYPLELHLVHQSADGGLAVVGVMAMEGAENPAFADIVASAPTEVTEEMVVEGVMVSAESLLPADRLYYGYSGSLTTPPCSEGVKWHVLTTPIELSAEQIETLAGILHDNFRPVQPLHERALAVDTYGS